MSIYGKKALLNWEYEGKNTFDELRRFHNTSKDLQMEILKKWYPIGSLFRKCTVLSNVEDSDFNGSFIIKEYLEYFYGWKVVVVGNDGMTYDVHPGFLRPSKEWLRDEKIKKLGI